MSEFEEKKNEERISEELNIFRIARSNLLTNGGINTMSDTMKRTMRIYYTKLLLDNVCMTHALHIN